MTPNRHRDITCELIECRTKKIEPELYEVRSYCTQHLWETIQVTDNPAGIPGATYVHTYIGSFAEGSWTVRHTTGPKQ